MGNLAFVKKIDGQKWHGVSSKDYTAPAISYECAVDPDTKRYIINLPEDRIRALAAKFPQILDMEWKSTGHPFFSDPVNYVKLNDGTTTFDLSNPREELMFGIAMGLPQVAPSEGDALARPHAEYYVWSVEVANKDKAALSQKRAKAYELRSQLTLNRMADIIMVIYKKAVSNLSPDDIMADIEDIISSHLDDFIMYAQLDDADIRVRASVVQAHAMNEIIIRDNVYVWGDMRLGRDIEEVVHTLRKPENHDILQRIQGKANFSQLGIKTPESLKQQKPKVRNDGPGNAVQVQAEDGISGQPETQEVPV